MRNSIFIQQAQFTNLWQMTMFTICHHFSRDREIFRCDSTVHRNLHRWLVMSSSLTKIQRSALLKHGMKSEKFIRTDVCVSSFLIVFSSILSTLNDLTRKLFFVPLFLIQTSLQSCHVYESSTNFEFIISASTVTWVVVLVGWWYTVHTRSRCR